MKRVDAAMLSSFVLLAAPSLAGAAYYYEATTSTGDGTTASTVHAWVDGDNSKVEFVDGSAGPGFTAGSYLLSNDGGQTLYLVDPDKKTVSEIDFAQIFKMVGSIADATQGLVKIEFSDFSSEKLGEEPGESILGYATTHYRYKTGYTMKIGVLGFARASRVDSELEFSCSKQLNDAGFAVWLRPDRFRSGNEGIDKLITQEYQALNCLPLRNKSVSTVTGPKGDKTTTTSTMEVTALRKGDAPAGAFVIPADYERTSLVPALSESDAAGAGDAPKDAEPAPKKKKRFRLKDLLDR